MLSHLQLFLLRRNTESGSLYVWVLTHVLTVLFNSAKHRGIGKSPSVLVLVFMASHHPALAQASIFVSPYPLLCLRSCQIMLFTVCVCVVCYMKDAKLVSFYVVVLVTPLWSWGEVCWEGFWGTKWAHLERLQLSSCDVSPGVEDVSITQGLFINQVLLGICHMFSLSALHICVYVNMYIYMQYMQSIYCIYRFYFFIEVQVNC